MGNFTGKEIAFTGDSDIDVDMGNIDIDLSAVKEAEVDLSTDMGNISVKSPETPVTNTDADFIGSTESAVYPGGLVIEAKTDMGSVNIK